MTDEEIRRLLRPRHNWTAIVGVIVAVAATAWGIARWAATVPTGEQFKAADERAWRLEMKVNTVDSNVSQVKNDVNDMKANVNEIRVNLNQIKERRR